MAGDEAATWEAARLIPVSGIGGPDEQDRRATSALLAVIVSVKEFARAVLAPLGGAPSGKVDTYSEVPFEVDGRTVQPDGVIQVTRGSKTWTALVEVKTKDNQLRKEQLENYLDAVRIDGSTVCCPESSRRPRPRA